MLLFLQCVMNTCKKSCCPILKLMKRKGACSYDVRQIFGLFKPLHLSVIYARNIRKIRAFLNPFLHSADAISACPWLTPFPPVCHSTISGLLPTTTRLISALSFCLLFRRERKSAATQERSRPRQTTVLFFVVVGSVLPQPRADLQDQDWRLGHALVQRGEPRWEV